MSDHPISGSALSVGAGTAEIVFDAAIFPIEGFNGKIHDNPHARVLVLNNGMQTAIVSLELVNAADEAITMCIDIVSKATGTDKANIWIHSTHAISTPHVPAEAASKKLFLTAVSDAVTKAAQQAAETLQPAVMGVGTGFCDVNANRDLELNGEWYYGMGSTLPANKTLTLLRFDALDGKPIAFFLSYGIKPTCIYNVEQNSGTRQISSDVPGLACMMMEEAFGAPCMFCMPAAGDQIPREIAMYYELGEDGTVRYVERSVAEGIEMMTRLGTEMGNTAIEVAKSIGCGTQPLIGYTSTAFIWPNKSGDGEVEITVDGIGIGGEVALVGLKPEVNCVTELDLWTASPYAHTLLVSFMNGDQKYMPDARAYERGTRESTRSGCAAGCAERFVEVTAELLCDLKAGKLSTRSRSKAGKTEKSASSMNRVVEFGGHTWFVLEKRAGKELLISEKVLEHRAYHSTFEPVTWETSDLRKYLNGDFYEKTFSEEEKAQIAETMIDNKSNIKYGVRGGNPTADRVFLLSLQEAEDYLFGFTHLLNALDAETGEVVWWYLRSPGESTDVAASVDASGVIDYHGVAAGVIDSAGGIRPALWRNAQV